MPDNFWWVCWWALLSVSNMSCSAVLLVHWLDIFKTPYSHSCTVFSCRWFAFGMNVSICTLYHNFSARFAHQNKTFHSRCNFMFKTFLQVIQKFVLRSGVNLVWPDFSYVAMLCFGLLLLFSVEIYFSCIVCKSLSHFFVFIGLLVSVEFIFNTCTILIYLIGGHPISSECI